MTTGGPRATLAFLAISASLGLSACGREEPLYRMRPAGYWADRLWSADPNEAASASEKLEAFAKTAPKPVLAALERVLTEPRPPPGATPFSLVIDEKEAARLGLTLPDPPDATGDDMDVLRDRALATGMVPITLKPPSMRKTTIDVTVGGTRTREEALRMQAWLARRGAFDLRVVVPDPAGGRPAGASRDVYDDPTPYADRLRDEGARFLAAREARKPYVPADRRWRAVLKAAAPGAPEAFALVEEPTSAPDTLDERIVDTVSVRQGGDGRTHLVVVVRRDKQEALARFAGANAGLRVGAVLDDVLLGDFPTPPAEATTLDLALWANTSAESLREAQALAGLLAPARRLPWPVRPLPLDERFGRDPLPKNFVTETLVAIGKPALPTLERVRSGAPLEWSRKSAAWAIEEIQAVSEPENR